MATFSERMPPPTGVVIGPLMETENAWRASSVSSGSHSPSPVQGKRLLPRVDLHPRDGTASAVAPPHRGVDHVDHHRRDVDADAVALDEGDDRTVGDVQAAVLRDPLILSPSSGTTMCSYAIGTP